MMVLFVSMSQLFHAGRLVTRLFFECIGVLHGKHNILCPTWSRLFAMDFPQPLKDCGHWPIFPLFAIVFFAKNGQIFEVFCPSNLYVWMPRVILHFFPRLMVPVPSWRPLAPTGRKRSRSRRRSARSQHDPKKLVRFEVLKMIPR